MNQIDKLIEINHKYWLSGKTTYLGAPGFAEKAKAGLKKIVEKHIGPNKELRGMDIGCGNGDNTSFLAPYFKYLDGFELSPERVEQAKKINPLPNGSYTTLDIEKDILPVDPASVDVIFFLGVISAIHSNEALSKLFNSFHSTLNQSGLLITRDSLSPRFTYRRPTESGYFAIYRSFETFLMLFENAGFELIDTLPLVKQEKLFNSMYVFKKVDPD